MTNSTNFYNTVIKNAKPVNHKLFTASDMMSFSDKSALKALIKIVLPSSSRKKKEKCEHQDPKDANVQYFIKV